MCAWSAVGGGDLCVHCVVWVHLCRGAECVCVPVLLTPAVLLGAVVCSRCDHGPFCLPGPSATGLPLPSVW